MNIFLTANMKTYDEFAALYSEGDEKRLIPMQGGF